jgi:hypothetical protein
VRDTPRVIDVAQFIGRSLNLGGSNPRTERAASNARRGPRAGRVNGVIQYAPADAARQPLPSETTDAAATPTLNGVPISQVQHGAAVTAAPAAGATAAGATP